MDAAVERRVSVINNSVKKQSSGGKRVKEQVGSKKLAEIVVKCLFGRRENVVFVVYCTY